MAQLKKGYDNKIFEVPSRKLIVYYCWFWFWFCVVVDFSASAVGIY